MMASGSGSGPWTGQSAESLGGRLKNRFAGFGAGTDGFPAGAGRGALVDSAGESGMESVFVLSDEVIVLAESDVLSAESAG